MKMPLPRVSAETHRQIAQYRRQYGALFDEIAEDVAEFSATGAMSRAKSLAAATGQHVNHNQYPMFFTGDLDADLVLVHLNPKQKDDLSPAFRGTLSSRTFEEYFDVHRNWGARFYGADADRTFKSRFDRKQIRFLRPFGTIQFADDDGDDAMFRNLERVVDHKLQMELVPYGSDKFNTGAFAGELMRPHFDRVLKVITARPRRYVLFCGAVFEPLVRDFVVKKHRFQLTKKDGTPEAMTSEFSNLSIPFQSGYVTAGWCRSWARQGIPMASYANEVFNRYAV